MSEIQFNPAHSTDAPTDSTASQDLSWLLTHSIIKEQFQAQLIHFEQQQVLHEFSQLTTGYDAFYQQLLKRLNIHTSTARKTLSNRFFPVFAFKEKQFFMLLGYKDGLYHLQDATGESHVSVLPAGFRYIELKNAPTATRKQSAKEVIKKIAYEQKNLLVYVAVATFIINILALGSSLYTMQVYDRVVSTGAMATLIALFIGTSIAIFLEMLLKFSKATLQNYAMKAIDRGYAYDIFNRFLQIRMDNLPNSVGRLSGQLQSYANVRAFITSAVVFFFIDFPFSFIFIAAISMIAGIKLGLIVLAFLFIATLTGLYFKGKIEAASKASSLASYKKVGLLVESIENAERIKANNAGWRQLGKWNALTDQAIDDDLRVKHYSDQSNFLTTFLQQISYISVIGVGAYLVSVEGEFTMGALIAVSILANRVMSPIAQLPNLFIQYGKSKLAVADLGQIYQLAIDNEGVEKPLHPQVAGHSLQLKNVSFAYQKDSQNSLNVAQLHIKTGEKVAILGAIGSGKTTLLKLMAGLFKPQQGQVLLDHIDIHQLSRDVSSQKIAFLPQEPGLISGSIRDNITFGLPGFSDAQILHACQETGLIRLINSLPKGLDTPIPENGGGVSGGQKQLIALTHIALVNKDVWLLDEPTANMDEGSERALIQMMQQKLTKEQTLVVVTHKPVILNLVDRIIVVTDHKIAMDDNKESVLAKIAQLRPQASAAAVASKPAATPATTAEQASASKNNTNKPSV